ncbi:MAG: isopentenyl phosphate kinase [Candidatus Bathyarchaeia archaeon]
MRKPLVVIKLGGAALTDKRKIYTARTNVVRSAARQIAAVTSRFTVIIVHGAGSYGHLPVKQFGLSRGFRNARQLKGLSETKFRLLGWELMLEEIFMQYKIPVIPLTPSDYVIARNGRIDTCNLSPIKEWMRLGCIPSTGGDIVPDVSTGFSVVSGDQLAVHIAVSLGASKLIFATDVDGIFDSDPKQNRKARLMRVVQTRNVQRIAAKVRPDITDVTGGMEGKIEEAALAASKGIPVFFVNLVKGNRLRDVVLGHKLVICSELVTD